MPLTCNVFNRPFHFHSYFLPWDPNFDNIDWISLCILDALYLCISRITLLPYCKPPLYASENIHMIAFLSFWINIENRKNNISLEFIHKCPVYFINKYIWDKFICLYLLSLLMFYKAYKHISYIILFINEWSIIHCRKEVHV